MYALFKWITRNENFFEKNGIKRVPGPPMVGNTSHMLMRKVTTQKFVTDVYNFNPEEKYLANAN